MGWVGANRNPRQPVSRDKRDSDQLSEYRRFSSRLHPTTLSRLQEQTMPHAVHFRPPPGLSLYIEPSSYIALMMMMMYKDPDAFRISPEGRIEEVVHNLRVRNVRLVELKSEATGGE